MGGAEVKIPQVGHSIGCYVVLQWPPEKIWPVKYMGVTIVGG